MQQVVRHTMIEELEQAAAGSQLVTVSATAAGGGVSTVLEQWVERTGRPTEFGTCPNLNPQRPLAAFGRCTEETISAIRDGDWPAAARHMADVQTEEPTTFVIDNADRLDEASARLVAALLEIGCRAVLGHHHAPPTNPPLELLLGGVPQADQRSVIVAPLTQSQVDTALGDGANAAEALTATGGNPLALSLYRRPRFASVAVEVLERFDRLPADGQALVAILAASPEPIPLGLVQAIGRPWDTHGAQIDRSDLATIGDAGVSLRHDKIRRILYEEMTVLRRRFVHAEILAHIDEADDLTTVMHHAVGAGDVETIITLGPRAAEDAAAMGAQREASRHLENVLGYEHSIPEVDRAALREALERSLAEAVG